jgi:protein disulfide-isomerase
MRAIKFILPIILTALALSSRADETLPVLQAGSETYSNVTVTSISATDIFFTYDGGMANVKLKELSPALQKHFNYEPQQAKAAELKLAEDKVKYHDQLIRQPAVQAPDLTREPANAAPAAAAVWRTDFPSALQQAQAEHKLVLIDFTGSDWCPWCIKFDQEVLTTDRFFGYAAKNLVLVKADFPRHTPQPENLIRANAALQKTFKVDGFPTYVLLKADGNELGRQIGYVAGGPDAFISELDGFSHR